MAKKKKTPNFSKTTLKAKQTGKQQEAQSVYQLNTPKKHNFFSGTRRKISFLFGIVSFLFFVFPRTPVYQAESLNFHDPFKTPFILKNDGYFPIYNIDYILSIEKLENINNHNYIPEGMPFNVAGGMRNIPKLSRNKTSVLAIYHAVTTPNDFVKVAEVHINIKYQLFPFKFPFSQITQNNHFKTERKSNGEYVWVEDYAAQ